MTNVNPHHNKIPRVRAELGSATFPNWEKMEATAALNWREPDNFTQNLSDRGGSTCPYQDHRQDPGSAFSGFQARPCRITAPTWLW